MLIHVALVCTCHFDIENYCCIYSFTFTPKGNERVDVSGIQKEGGSEVKYYIFGWSKILHEFVWEGMSFIAENHVQSMTYHGCYLWLCFIGHSSEVRRTIYQQDT